MSAYFIVDNRKVHDLEKLNQYIREVPATVEEFGGRYIVAGSTPEAVEGEWKPTSIVIIEFPSSSQAKAWYESESYQKVKIHRIGNAEADMVLVPGIDEQPINREAGI